MSCISHFRNHMRLNFAQRVGELLIFNRVKRAVRAAKAKLYSRKMSHDTIAL